MPYPHLLPPRANYSIIGPILRGRCVYVAECGPVHAVFHSPGSVCLSLRTCMGGMSDKYTDPIHLGRGCDLQMRSGVADTLRREKSACVLIAANIRRNAPRFRVMSATLVIIVNRVPPVRSGCGYSKPHHPTAPAPAAMSRKRPVLSPSGLDAQLGRPRH